MVHFPLKMMMLVDEHKVRDEGTHLAPPRADYEQAFAGANFNTEIVSGAPLRSPEHIF